MLVGLAQDVDALVLEGAQVPLGGLGCGTLLPVSQNWGRGWGGGGKGQARLRSIVDKVGRLNSKCLAPRVSNSGPKRLDVVGS